MISLRMNRTDFENDIRALLMAFYYGEKIVLDAPEWEVCLQVVYRPDGGIHARLQDASGRTMEGESGAASGKLTEAEAPDASETAAEGKCRPGAEPETEAAAAEGMKPLKLADDPAAYRGRRNEVKQLIYRLLGDFTGRTLPWGTLTGIRPTKLAMEIFERGGSDEDAAAYLRETYLTSGEKAALCAEVARNEQAILQGIDYENTYSLYVGVPFCPSICAYCSFSSYPLSVWQSRTDDYVDALLKEIEAASHMLPGRKPVTFYMGGGTPTSLSAAQLDRVLGSIRDHFDLSAAREMTVEAGRPDSIIADKLQVIKDHGISRISINPQTMNQRTLDLIGRRHTALQIHEAFDLARRIGFDNINMDLIAGLPGERAEDMRHTMAEITAMAPENVTVHSLALKRAAFLNQNREQFPVAGAEEVNEMIRISREGAARIGARPYYLYRQKNIAGNLENVGYAKPGTEGLYNILIMEEKQSILALGTGASSKFVMKGIGDTVRIERVENVKSVGDYISRIDEMIGRKERFLAGNAL